MAAEACSGIDRLEVAVVGSVMRVFGRERRRASPRRIRRRSPLVASAAIWALFVTAAVAKADVVELLSGAKVEGRIVARDEKSVSIETKIGDKTFTRTYPLERVAALTVGDRREVLASGRAGSDGSGAPGGSSGAGGSNGSSGTSDRAGTSGEAGRSKTGESADAKAGVSRTKEEVERIIAQQGRTPPDWFEAAALNYPKTLDLYWTSPPPRVWDNQRYLGQYIWDIINPNPSRWREGVKLMHHVLSLNQDRPEARRRTMDELGRMYFILLQDFARAAFWWQQAQAQRGDLSGSDGGVHLAECYWRLGNKQMAVELLEKLPPNFSMIKLWADLGELDRALKLAEANASGAYADIALLYAGDACRTCGKYADALRYYQRALQVPFSGRGKGRYERNQRRAAANAEAIKLFELLDLSKVPDGTYRASSVGYEADVYVEVVVKDHRIVSVRVTDHREKQYYASMTEIPRRIVERQTVRGIDAVSGATLTSEAIVNATAKALAAAMKK